MITLYGYWRSTAAYRVRIALNIKQLTYSQKSVHLLRNGGEQHQSDYASLNPQCLVPTLIDNDTGCDAVIGQSMAILEYLEEKYSNIPLMPCDIIARSKIRQLSQLVVSDIHPLNNLRVLQYLSKTLEVDDEERQTWYHHWILKGFQAYEAILEQNQSNGTFSVGEELSLADVCLIPQIYNAQRYDVDLAAFPRLMKINANCLKLACFQRAIPDNQPDAV